jgi:predicted ABC-type ATPase
VIIDVLWQLKFKLWEWRRGLADSPQLLVVGGPNGAGKTTLAREYASVTGITYLGADAIAESLAPNDPASARFDAGRQFIESVDEHLSRQQSLIVETTLSGLTFRHNITKAQQLGFDVSIAYLFMDSTDGCIARVAERVRKGGHDVPEADIRRRFVRSVANFWTTYREMADSWVPLYNGAGTLQDVAAGAREQASIRDATLFSDFMTLVGTPNDD